MHHPHRMDTSFTSPAAASGNSTYPWNYQTLQRRRRRPAAIDDSFSSSSSMTMPADASAAWTTAASVQPPGHHSLQRSAHHHRLQLNPQLLVVVSSPTRVKPEAVNGVIRRPLTCGAAVGGTGRNPSSCMATPPSMLSLQHQRNCSSASNGSPRRSSAAIERRSCSDFGWLQAAKMASNGSGRVGGSTSSVNGCGTVGRRPTSLASLLPLSSQVSGVFTRFFEKSMIGRLKSMGAVATKTMFGDRLFAVAGSNECNDVPDGRDRTIFTCNESLQSNYLKELRDFCSDASTCTHALTYFYVHC